MASSMSSPTSSGSIPDASSARRFVGTKTIAERNVGVYWSRAQHAGANRRFRQAQLDPQRVHQRNDSVLGDVIGPKHWPTGQPSHRRRGGDVAFALLLEQRQERAHAVDHRPQIDIEGPLPLVQGHLVQRAGNADASVVGHDMNRSERVERSVSKGLNL